MVEEEVALVEVTPFPIKYIQRPVPCFAQHEGR